MTTAQLEMRVQALEQEMARLKSQITKTQSGPNAWVEKVAAKYSSPADKAAFDQAMHYGRQWRNAQRPKLAKRRVTVKK